MPQFIDFQRNNSLDIPVFFRLWPVKDAKAVVCIVHGMGEHIGRYGHVAKFFSEHGIETIGFDHQGHGQTPGKRGHSEGLSSMLDDITQLITEASLGSPGKPIFLYGHSMGGNLVLNHVLRRKPNIAGVVATDPWVRLPKPPSPFLVAFAKVMCHIAPKHTQSNGLDINGLSTDTKVIEAYKNDPLVHDRVSVKLGIGLLNGAKWLDSYSGTAPCPLLLMHGGADPLTLPKATEELSKRLQGDVTFRRWPGLKHEIHNEPQQAEVLAFLVEWMKRLL